MGMAVLVEHYAGFPDVGGHRNMEVITPSCDVSLLFGPGPPPLKNFFHSTSYEAVFNCLIHGIYILISKDVTKHTSCLRITREYTILSYPIVT